MTMVDLAYKRSEGEEMRERNEKEDKERKKSEKWSKSREMCRGHLEVLNFEERPANNDKVVRFLDYLFFKKV